MPYSARLRGWPASRKDPPAGGFPHVDPDLRARLGDSALRRLSLLLRQARVLRRVGSGLPAPALHRRRVGDEASRPRGEVLLVMAPRQRQAALVVAGAIGPEALRAVLAAAERAGATVSLGLDGESWTQLARQRPE